MASQTSESNSGRTVITASQTVGIALFCLMGLTMIAYAQTPDTGWQGETRIYLAGMTNYRKRNGASQSHQSFAAAAELRLSSDAQPWYASLFAEYHLSNDTHFNNIVNLGGYLRYKLQDWDATTFMLVNRTPGKAAAWYYAGRLRYRIAEDHKVGVEAVGSFRNARSPAVALGYYGSISDSLSLNVIADPGVNHGTDLAARLELVWQVH